MWRDWLLERGIQPPWPIEEKATSVKGSALAARVSACMAKIAASQTVLATLEEQRAAAEASVAAAEAELERIGISSISQLSGLSGQKSYAVCAQPGCEKVELYSWRSADPGSGWRCDEHELPAPAPPTPGPLPTPDTERAAAALDEEQPF